MPSTNVLEQSRRVHEGDSRLFVRAARTGKTACMSASVEHLPSFRRSRPNCTLYAAARGTQIATHIKPAALCGAPPAAGSRIFTTKAAYQRQARGARGRRHDAVEAVLDCDDDGRHGQLAARLVPGDGIELQAHIIQRRHGADEQTHAVGSPGRCVAAGRHPASARR